MIFSGSNFHSSPRSVTTLLRISKLFGSILSTIASISNNSGSSSKYLLRATTAACLAFSFESTKPSKNGKSGISFLLKCPIFAKTLKIDALTELEGFLIKGMSLGLNYTQTKWL